MKIRKHEHHERLALQMTPMIDVVFQLMVFFVFTFKIARPEGDFHVRMPADPKGAAAHTAAEPMASQLLKVRLRANGNRELAAIELGNVVLNGDKPFELLQTRLRSMVDDSAGPGASEHQVEIEADYNLRYGHVMNAMSAITAYKDPATGATHKLIEKVRFAPRARPEGEQ